MQNSAWLLIVFFLVKFAQASDCPDVEICTSYGEQNFLAGNLKEAERFFRACAEYGDKGRCVFGLGATMAESGDYEQAIKYLKSACDAGYKKGCENVPGTQKRLAELKKAKQGFARHWVEIGTARMERNHFEAARTLFAKGCERRFPPACSKLGEVEDLLGDREAAKKHLAQGCTGKDYEGCRLLGVFEYRSGEKEKARKTFELGCRNKHYASCGFLGGIEIKSGKAEKGRELLELACDHSVLDACESLAFQYSKEKQGEKTKLVVDKIKGLLKPQCDSGRTDACRRLTSLQ